MWSALLLFTNLVFAQCVTSGDSTAVSGSGGSQCIDRHGTCRVVTNSNAASIMVPHKTAAEWSGASGFVPNTQPGVSKSSCSSFGSPLFLPWIGEPGYTEAICNAATFCQAITDSLTFAVTNGPRDLALVWDCQSGDCAGTPSYSKNGGAWTPYSTAGVIVSIANGDTLRIRAVASASAVYNIYFRDLTASGSQLGYGYLMLEITAP
jgi:hypothetical protein